MRGLTIIEKQLLLDACTDCGPSTNPDDYLGMSEEEESATFRLVEDGRLIVLLDGIDEHEGPLYRMLITSLGRLALRLAEVDEKALGAWTGTAL